MKNRTISLLLMIVSGVLIVNSIKGCQKAKEFEILNEAIEAELQTWKNKDGNNMAKIQVLETENINTFTKLEVKDSLIQELQKEVIDAKSKLKSGGSVTIVEGETKFDTIFVPQYDKIYNKIFEDSIITSINNDWISTDFGFTLDSINNSEYKIGSVIYGLEVKNKYTVTIGRENNRAFAEVKNLNPYSSTTALRTYQVTLPKPPKLSIGAFFGPGLLMAKEPKLGLVAGAGINFKF